MAISDEVRVFYEGLDSATLLALLPELRVQVGRFRSELQRHQSSTQALEDADAELSDTLGEGLAALASRLGTDDPMFIETRDRLNALRPQIDTERYEEHFNKIFVLLVDLTARERWIEGELARRGLLPLYS